ncbi:DNA processing protein [Paenibacillus sophorae]|uniref:DNA processing protein n=1 Tax=Paenibacillus sophorae TaxID=1333845 RepID=A0A1H8GNT2_9BACL|nr:DNA-processing protein DprA [Paenibacillus sophorae]QWU14294.1 DNA-protecting protein DprA [Paenibacillus sophorae]SEN45771.1 DNA processing protein [Paenibacillus sophorae]
MNYIKVSGINVDLKNREKWVAIIGSRNASTEEYKTAFNFSYNLASQGYKIVSGLAKNIDTAAHKGAIEARGQTIAIVNTPIEQDIYPWQNKALAEQIRQFGCIIHPFASKAIESNEKGLSQFSRRLIERDRLLARLCPKIVTVKNEGVIDGGTRYGMTYGKLYGQDVYRYDNQLTLHKDPEVKEGKIWWDMELDIEGLVEEYFNIEEDN